jgi:hypothetical protein
MPIAIASLAMNIQGEIRENQLNSWSEFKTLADAANPFGIEIPEWATVQESPILYRGHSNAVWPLQTTLERAGINSIAASRYHKICTSAARRIGNFQRTNIAFDEDANLKVSPYCDRLPNYEYMAYLRHHGFPSPLLDWSRSPYVAAFFAFRHAYSNRRPTAAEDPEATQENVAIYLFQDMSYHGKNFAPDSPHIERTGGWVSVHERHAIQQCEYTICVKETADQSFSFCPHSQGFTRVSPGETEEQDHLLKLLIPASERRTAVNDLRRMNITPYSMFLTSDALMETVAEEVLNGRE